MVCVVLKLQLLCYQILCSFVKFNSLCKRSDPLAWIYDIWKIIASGDYFPSRRIQGGSSSPVLFQLLGVFQVLGLVFFRCQIFQVSSAVVLMIEVYVVDL